MKNLILLISLTALLASCGGTKHITTNKENRDSLTIVEKDNQIAELQKEVSQLRTYLREREYLSVEIQPCPPAINTDSLRDALIAANCSPDIINRLSGYLQQAQATIERQADGTLKITGQVKSLTSIKSKLEETVKNQNTEIATLKTELEKAKSHVKTQTVEKIKEVKRGLSWWAYWLFLIAVILAVIAGWWLKTKADQLGEREADKLATRIRKPIK